MLILLGILTLLGGFWSLVPLRILSEAQFWLFGYFGYLWLFVIAYSLYKTTAIPNFKSTRFQEKSLGVAIGIFALLVLQGLFLGDVGIVGTAFNGVLKPLITPLGIFFATLAMLVFSIVLYSGKSFKEVFYLVAQDLKKDFKEDIQKTKKQREKIAENNKKIKNTWLKIKAFFTPQNLSKHHKTKETEPSHKEHLVRNVLQDVLPKNFANSTPHPLTLEELIEQSKNNPPPPPHVQFKFGDESLNEEGMSAEEDFTTKEDSSDKSRGFESESGIDVERQEVELPMREDNPLESQESLASQIRIVRGEPSTHQQENFDPMMFQKRSIESLENFKRFEQSNFYQVRKEEEKEETIRLVKNESKQVQDQNEQSLQNHTKPKQLIRAYPKNLYSMKPFSAYYDKESVGARDCLVDNPTQHGQFQQNLNELPTTIFYYGNLRSAHPLDVIPQDHKDEDVKMDASSENPKPQSQENISNRETPQSQKQESFTQVQSQSIPAYGYAFANYAQNSENFPAESKLPPREAQALRGVDSSKEAQLPQDSTPEVISLFSATTKTQSTPQTPAQTAPQIPTQQEVSAEKRSEVRTNEIPQELQEVKDSKDSNAIQSVTHISQQKSAQLQASQPKEVETTKDAQVMGFAELVESREFILPKLEFLQLPQGERVEIDENEIDRKINDLLSKLRMFKIEGDIVRTYSGPIVTTFEFRPNQNVKVSRILALQDDLAMALRAKTIRIQAPVPGKDVVGIEIPNNQIETIYLREILEHELFRDSKSPLTLALGKDIVGNPFVTDLQKLPHLLIAGTTGSGKSVGINAMILSLLYKNTPDQLRLLMIDPKMLEFSIYNEIPHLIAPVITQPKRAIAALDNMVKEMERRYTLMSEARIKNIEGYNQKAEIEGFEPFPYIVVVIDELADLMMSGGKEAEVSISRLAQMARASGIHLIVATQRPSVDVVTGLIKANLPARISYKVGQKIDSKVILDCFGAESLLGRGDMLFTLPGSGIVRLHAPWSSEKEIEKIVEFIKSQRAPQYDENFMPSEDEALGLKLDGEIDDLYEEAKRIMLADGKTSISYLQRRLGIGYNKAANIIEQMQSRGFLSEPDSKNVRKIIGN